MTTTAPSGDGAAESWQQEAAPAHHEGRSWSLRTLVDLADARPDIRSHLTEQFPPVVTDGGEGIERALLVADEMASNGIRHAGPPVRLTISLGEGSSCLVISVADRTPELLPAPDRHRDPTQGGLGLQMIAAFSNRHGWSPDGQGKTVWATLPASADPTC